MSVTAFVPRFWRMANSPSKKIAFCVAPRFVTAVVTDAVPRVASTIVPTGTFSPSAATACSA